MVNFSMYVNDENVITRDNVRFVTKDSGREVDRLQWHIFPWWQYR